MKNWKFRLTKKAKKQFERLGSEVQKRIRKRCEVISKLDDPRDFDKSLQGNLSKYWSYRVGDWRLICEFYDNEALILVIKIDHRSTVYKTKK